MSTLFTQKPLSQYLAESDRQWRNIVDRLTLQAFVGRSVPQHVDELTKKHTPAVPEIDFGKTSPPKVTSGGSTVLYHFEAPFSGDSNMFDYRPSKAQSLKPVNAATMQGRFHFTIDSQYRSEPLPAEAKDRVFNDARSLRELVENYLAFSKAECNEFALTLKERITEAVQKRYDNLKDIEDQRKEMNPFQ